MTDIYQGDPKLYITEEGADFNYPDNVAQPEMEQGLENLTILSLFTRENWEGNFYLKNDNQKIGSDYEETAEKPITLSNIELLRQSTIRALSNPAFGSVESVVTVPSVNQKNNVIKISPPGKDIETIILNQNGLNWLLQAEKEG